MEKQKKEIQGREKEGSQIIASERNPGKDI